MSGTINLLIMGMSKIVRMWNKERWPPQYQTQSVHNPNYLGWIRNWCIVRIIRRVKSYAILTRIPIGKRGSLKNIFNWMG